jgi:hypothetical protein
MGPHSEATARWWRTRESANGGKGSRSTNIDGHYQRYDAI